jgi:NADPH2:quinone reductase
LPEQSEGLMEGFQLWLNLPAKDKMSAPWYRDLQSAELPLPELPSPAHLLVRLKAAGVNPIDTKLRKNGTYFPDRLPTVLGCDGAGVVESTGNAVTRFKPGD